MYNPKVSIIIPVYNGANYVSEAIESALAQTYKNIEIIVVNDGSNDKGKTEAIALSYGDKIRYIAKENGGSSSALNTGIKNMNGEYFSWLSHDDLYTPAKVEKSIEKINPEIAEKQAIVCGSELIDASGNMIFHPHKEPFGDFTSAQMLEQYCKNYRINGCAILIPKSLIDKTGLFDENFVYVNDVDYWYRLMAKDCIFTCFTDRLVKTRMHGEQVSVKKANLFKKESAILADKIFDMLLENIDDNIDKIKCFIKKSGRDGNKFAVKKVISILKHNNKITFIYSIKVTYNIYMGEILRFLKKIYKRIFLRR